jgi:NAD-dependent dihydropyrimidine dehydrogenase PreA subunit
MTKQALREIIEIDEDLCDGCGLCIPNCEEGALVIVDGKVRLVEDARCDGAGACLGHCPQGALRITHREAEAFDEQYAGPAPHVPASAPVPKPMPMPQAMMMGAPDVVKLGLRAPGGGCPGSRAMEWKAPAVAPASQADSTEQPSALRQWPVQLHLLSPAAPFLRGRELLLAADCVAFALGGFHGALLAGRSLAVACPKLDDPSGYEEKLVSILTNCDVPALRVAIMEVPCCGGLVGLAQRAVQGAGYEGEVEVIVVSRFGEILEQRILSGGKSEALRGVSA